MTRSLGDESVTRYFPYLAFELRDAGQSHLADRIFPSDGPSPTKPPADLEEILKQGMAAGVNLAFIVERERRALELVTNSDAPELADELRKLQQEYEGILHADHEDNQVGVMDRIAQFDVQFAAIARRASPYRLVKLLATSDIVASREPATRGGSGE